MAVFLGVDGGGTKTAFIAINDDGAILARATAASAYYFGDTIDLVGRVLAEGVAVITAELGIAAGDIDRSYFGLPGHGEVARDVPVLDAIPRSILGNDRYGVGNDTVCAWAGSLGAADGINVISGTGSITYGQREGRGHRVGGWGEFFGDEGSAYWIAIRGLNAFSRMSDGRLERGPLYDLLKARLGVTEDLDVIDVVINRWGAQRGQIADLSRTVVDAAEAGDNTARAIIADAAGELASLVTATRAALGYAPGDPAPVSYSGGVFTAPAMAGAFGQALAGSAMAWDLRRPLFTPVVGAALYAARQAGTPLSEDALARLADRG